MRPSQRHRNPRRCQRRSRVVRSPSLPRALPRASRMTRNGIGTRRSAKKKTASKKSSRFPRSGAGRRGAGARASASRHFEAPCHRAGLRNRFRYPAPLLRRRAVLTLASPQVSTPDRAELLPRFGLDQRGTGEGRNPRVRRVTTAIASVRIVGPDGPVRANPSSGRSWRCRPRNTRRKRLPGRRGREL